MKWLTKWQSTVKLYKMDFPGNIIEERNISTDVAAFKAVELLSEEISNDHYFYYAEIDGLNSTCLPRHPKSFKLQGSEPNIEVDTNMENISIESSTPLFNVVLDPGDLEIKFEVNNYTLLPNKKLIVELDNPRGATKEELLKELSIYTLNTSYRS